MEIEKTMALQKRRKKRMIRRKPEEIEKAVE